MGYRCPRRTSTCSLRGDGESNRWPLGWKTMYFFTCKCKYPRMFCCFRLSVLSVLILRDWKRKALPLTSNVFQIWIWFYIHLKRTKSKLKPKITDVMFIYHYLSSYHLHRHVWYNTQRNRNAASTFHPPSAEKKKDAFQNAFCCFPENPPHGSVI